MWEKIETRTIGGRKVGLFRARSAEGGYMYAASPYDETARVWVEPTPGIGVYHKGVAWHIATKELEQWNL